VRGSPLLRALLAFLVIAALGYPLQLLTNRAPFQAVAAEPAKADESEVRVRFTCTAPLSKLTVLHLGEPVLDEAAPGAELDRTLKMHFPDEGVDLQIQASWAPEVKAALRVQLTDSRGEEHERTLWGSGEVDEVLTFQ
jgi:hypothetical protein